MSPLILMTSNDQDMFKFLEDLTYRPILASPDCVAAVKATPRPDKEFYEDEIYQVAITIRLEVICLALETLAACT